MGLLRGWPGILSRQAWHPAALTLSRSQARVLSVPQRYGEILPDGLVMGEEWRSWAVILMMLTSGDDIERLPG